MPRKSMEPPAARNQHSSLVPTPGRPSPHPVMPAVRLPPGHVDAILTLISFEPIFTAGFVTAPVSEEKPDIAGSGVTSKETSPRG